MNDGSMPAAGVHRHFGDARPGLLRPDARDIRMYMVGRIIRRADVEPNPRVRLHPPDDRPQLELYSDGFAGRIDGLQTVVFPIHEPGDPVREEDENHDIHVHDLPEICIIVENEARYRFNDAESVGKPGDLFICRPFELHWIFSRDPDKPSRWIYVLVSPLVVRSVPGGYDLLSPFYMNRSLSA